MSAELSKLRKEGVLDYRKNCHLTETVRPDSVGIGGARGRKTSWMGKDLVEDTNMNDLMSGDFGYIDPIHGGVIDTVRVKIYKA